MNKIELKEEDLKKWIQDTEAKITMRIPMIISEIDWTKRNGYCYKVRFFSSKTEFLYPAYIIDDGKIVLKKRKFPFLKCLDPKFLIPFL